MQKKTIIILIAAAFIGSCRNEKSALQKVVHEQLQRHPVMQIQDLYKLAYQAALGNEHLMSDSAMVHNYLIHELESVQASSAEPLLEEISPDGNVVRLNLRPFKAQQGDHRALFQAMMQTARNFPKSPGRLARYLSRLEQMAASGDIPFEATAVQSYFREMRNKSYPAVHHSAVYEEKHSPAYRVMLKKYVPSSK
ncbi:MAG: hypothetical protein ONB46_20710 [candidate division KSB1 bacterium]|nr:hypothetical protein [candidate division KSB1 bacterium]MDZ7368221.1 hypothetical protein [candidate division KSB1 bacterium]